MTKKNILSASILVVAVIITGAILLAGLPKAQAAPLGGTIESSCQNICVQVLDSDGWWHSVCYVDCPGIE